MLKGKKPCLPGIMVGLIIPLLVGMATPAFARSISLNDAGIALWIFIIIGTVIVLLQLIPASILFFSFIGTAFSSFIEGESCLSGRHRLRRSLL
jgi:hypothetical protein